MRVLGPQAALLAEAEGLIGHAQAIRTRLNSSSRKARPNA
jgi:histidinol dehydrogenase